MTPQQRAERLRYKLEWCGLPKGTLDRDAMGNLASLGGMHTNGSRQLWEVCYAYCGVIPTVAPHLPVLPTWRYTHCGAIPTVALYSLWRYAYCGHTH